jgi:hypothetical protein
MLKGESNFMSVVAYAFLGFLAAQAPVASPVSAEPTLDQVRAATERFKDVKVALAEGYVRDPMDECVTASSIGYPGHEGTMGIHYVRMDLLGIKGPPSPRVTGSSTHTDFNKPAVLIYEPQADGSLQLVAVENLVFKKAWHDAGNKARPTFHGTPYNYMADDPATKIDEGHMFEPHYDLHVWLYRDNPAGVFAQFNPDVSCAAHKSKHAETAAK